MYNGIGILTPRGTGTSGYVQSNKFNLRPGRGGGAWQQQQKETTNQPANKQPNQEILEHNRKREIEVKLAEMADALEEKGYTQEEIDTELATMRKQLEAEAAARFASEPSAEDKLKQETHEMAARKLQQMDKLKAAFGIEGDVNEGDAFNRELQEQKRQQRQAEREAREAERAQRGRDAPAWRQGEHRQPRHDDDRRRGGYGNDRWDGGRDRGVVLEDDGRRQHGRSSSPLPRGGDRSRSPRRRSSRSPPQHARRSRSRSASQGRRRWTSSSSSSSSTSSGSDSD